ncbi:type II toxin-antitoxin system VapC family toxin [Geoalkalibacter sp.]|uniref:type II toxin-antitoxin system VapC family toxin n=1 Tax=Geoalkalibacter sp. TaxID=3041440 RepID=UPI00272EB7A1|nr:type II toxin-antitoxin system VapC family toxin [Geoalkalibacter sp.]
MKRVLLDTSAYSLLMRGGAEVAKLLDAADEVFVPVVMIGELLAGFKKGRQEQRNRQILEDFLAVPRVGILSVDDETAERYAVIQDYLRRRGMPIPTNDLWIAACAMQHGLILITGDGHFLNVPQVVTELVPAR